MPLPGSWTPSCRGRWSAVGSGATALRSARIGSSGDRATTSSAPRHPAPPNKSSPGCGNDWLALSWLPPVPGEGGAAKRFDSRSNSSTRARSCRARRAAAAARASRPRLSSAGGNRGPSRPWFDMGKSVAHQAGEFMWGVYPNLERESGASSPPAALCQALKWSELLLRRFAWLQCQRASHQAPRYQHPGPRHPQ